MTDRLVIDGLDLNPVDHFEIKAGVSFAQIVADLGGTVTVEHVPWDAQERTITAEAAALLRDYNPEDPGSILAIFWRHHSLEAEEFDTVEEAERFIEGSEEYGSLAGEAIVAGDEITVLD